MSKRTTRPMRWHEVCRAALIIGVIDEYEKGQLLQLHKRCMERAAEGQCHHEKVAGRSIWRGYTADSHFDKEDSASSGT